MDLVRRAPLSFCLVFALLTIGCFQLLAQSPSNLPRSDGKIQMAGLRPGLVWQRSSPQPGAVEGPVAYQLLFSTAGMPGTIAKFDINPRHLTNSLITDNGTAIKVGLSNTFSIGQDGVMTFAAGQTFPGGTSSVQITAGQGLTATPGTITTIGSLALNTGFTDARYLQLSGGALTGGLSGTTAAFSSNVSSSGIFSGNGSGLTNLSNSQIVDGTLLQRKAALLQWYRQDFAVGGVPYAVAFDGTNIWVVNEGGNSVSKLRASDGTSLGAFAVGAQPFALAFDGANIWVTNINSNNVSKLRASDGMTLGTFTVGTNPIGVAFDGTNIWVANTNGNNVTRLRASDGAPQGGPFTVGTTPFGVAFDGANIWVTNQGTNNVSKLRASDGMTLGTFTVGTNPQSVAFDGANIWVANQGTNNVTKLRASDGMVLGTFTVGTGPNGLAFDGANIWVANNGSNTVSKLRASDGVLLETFAVGSHPVGVAFDGANVWVVNYSNNSVSKL